MRAGRLLKALVMATLLVGSAAAHATFHLWQITEIYTNADGSVQFVEFRTGFGAQQFLGGHTLTSTQGASTRSFTFPADLPSDTTNRHFLVGTAGFAALGIVTPDYIVPDNFLFMTNGNINFAGVDNVSYAALPTNGVLSIDHSGATAVNSPTNFAGATGSVPAPTVPGAPVIGPAVAGSGQATISFTAPSSSGGISITGYTATCNPGAVAASGAASPITVTGLANGTPYSCSVTATNAIGTGPASGSVVVTPAAIVKSALGASPTGTGTISASFTGGGATCALTTAQFIALSADPGSPPPGSAPPEIVFPEGLFAFRTTACTAGATITMTMTYPVPLPAGTQYWKYGPTASQPAPHWYVLPATIAATTAVFSITDGGLGDDDLAANGTIVDQGGPGGPPPGGPAAVPTLGDLALLALAALLVASGSMRLSAARATRRSRRSPARR